MMLDLAEECTTALSAFGSFFWETAAVFPVLLKHPQLEQKSIAMCKLDTTSTPGCPSYLLTLSEMMDAGAPEHMTFN